MLGHYGPVPGVINPWVLDRILSTPRASALTEWTRPIPTLSEIRRRFTKSISGEELLVRFMTSNEEVDRMLAAGPIRTDPRQSANEIVNHLAELIGERWHSRPTSLQVTTPGYQVRLSAAKNE